MTCGNFLFNQIFNYQFPGGVEPTTLPEHVVGCFSDNATVTCVIFCNIKFFKLSLKDVCPLLNLLIETIDLLLNLKLLNHG
jgi:hypothetical protein